MSGPFSTEWTLREDGPKAWYGLDLRRLLVDHRGRAQNQMMIKFLKEDLANNNLAVATRCILRFVQLEGPDVSVTSGFALYIRGKEVNAKLHPDAPRANVEDVARAIEFVNLFIRKRVSASHCEFFDGLKMNRDTFVRTLRAMPKVEMVPQDLFVVGGPYWNRLAASAVVQCNVDVERFVPCMLRELHELVVDAIFVPPYTLDELFVQFPGSKRIVKTEMGAVEGGGAVDLLREAERIRGVEGRDVPLPLLALRKHNAEAVKTCKIDLNDVAKQFKLIFPNDDPKNEKMFFTDALKEYFETDPPVLLLRVASQGGAVYDAKVTVGKYVACCFLSHPSLPFYLQYVFIVCPCIDQVDKHLHLAHSVLAHAGGPGTRVSRSSRD